MVGTGVDRVDARVGGVGDGRGSADRRSPDELRLRIWRLLERRGHVREVLGDALVELDRRNHVVVAQGKELDLSPETVRGVGYRYRPRRLEAA